MTLTSVQARVVEENMGLVGKVIKDKVERKRLEKAIEDFCESTEKDVDI